MIEIKETDYFDSKIRQLNSKRQKHENIISLLLGQTKSCDSSQDPSRKLIKKCISFNPNYKEQVPAQLSNRSNASNASTISQQVNLEAYLYQTQKQNYTGSKINYAENVKNLLISIQKMYSSNIGIQVMHQQNANVDFIMAEEGSSFQIVAQYLTEADLWDEVFIKRQEGYYAVVSSEFFDSQFILLSHEPLQQHEMSLLIDQTYEKSENLLNSNSNSISGPLLYIGYILLHRLLSLLGHVKPTVVFLLLFGFPFEQFQILFTDDYLKLKQTIKQNKRRSLVLGEKSLNKTIEKISNDLTAMSSTFLNKLLKKYNKICLIDQIQDLCSKSISVKHRRNHHVVVDIDNGMEKQVEVYLTFVDNINKLTSFRFCLVDQEGQLVQYSKLYCSNFNPIKVTLASQCQYKLYISQIRENTLQQFASFKVVFQSKTQLSRLSLNLKFDQSYKVMTEMLINKYLSLEKNLDEVQKQMIRLSNVHHNYDILVVRAKMNFMGLLCDFISIQNKKRCSDSWVQIQYEGQAVFCDRYFQQNRRKIKINSNKIYQICLSKDSQLKWCSGLKFSFSYLVF